MPGLKTWLSDEADRTANSITDKILTVDPNAEDGQQKMDRIVRLIARAKRQWYRRVFNPFNQAGRDGTFCNKCATWHKPEHKH